MAAADARAYLFRGGGPPLAVAAAFCAVHRRRLIFSAANDLDFDFGRPDRSRWQLAAYRPALRSADIVVAQRAEQHELARAAGLAPLEVIPSFAEQAEPSRADPEAFLWAGRLVDYKRPLYYVRLAEALPKVRVSDDLVPNRRNPCGAYRGGRGTPGRRLDNLEMRGQTPRTRSSS